MATASARAQPPAGEIWFDIPAQPVASALSAYVAVTGRPAAYNGNLAVGRISAAVKGRLTAAAALHLLLSDTGLLARETDAEAFVVVPAADEPLVGAPPTTIAANALSRQSPEQQRYSGIIQSAVNGALCARPETAPGAYRLAISFRVGALGDIVQLKLLSTTGDEQRDRAIVMQLRSAAVGEAPPLLMPQPFTMVLLPLSSGGRIDCPPSRSRDG